MPDDFLNQFNRAVTERRAVAHTPRSLGERQAVLFNVETAQRMYLSGKYKAVEARYMNFLRGNPDAPAEDEQGSLSTSGDSHFARAANSRKALTGLHPIHPNVMRHVVSQTIIAEGDKRTLQESSTAQGPEAIVARTPRHLSARSRLRALLRRRKWGGTDGPRAPPVNSTVLPEYKLPLPPSTATTSKELRQSPLLRGRRTYVVSASPTGTHVMPTPKEVERRRADMLRPKLRPLAPPPVSDATTAPVQGFGPLALLQ